MEGDCVRRALALLDKASSIGRSWEHCARLEKRLKGSRRQCLRAHHRAQIARRNRRAGCGSETLAGREGGALGGWLDFVNRGNIKDSRGCGCSQGGGVEVWVLDPPAPLSLGSSRQVCTRDPVHSMRKLPGVVE
ncbi:hypothetical protein NDU88_007572 [Pleurodeles waltl]|uniref:Uncharacterized protein n=1 Tax=Pleurodeles waltl TaxID=8319 RepID=A0AAV7QSA5_PLEWA|nr:hypothetical protein NDU88_007572 [Pleurodeles waltl]